MQHPLYCCHRSICGPLTIVQRHLIEAHGIVPQRAPQRGDVVYPLPAYADPMWYVVARARQAVRCRGCRQLIEAGELNASQQWETAHYCVPFCAGWYGGTPAGQAEMKQAIQAQWAARDHTQKILARV